MSRKRSRADASPHGPLPLAEQVPLYARNPRGLFRPVESRGAWRPIWKMKASRQALIFVIAAPLAIVALVILLAAIQALFAH